MIPVVAGLLKAALVRLGRAVFGEAAGDVDLPELARQAEDAMRPHGPPEPSQPLPYRDVERQRAQAASAARPETARPPPLPGPSLAEPPFPATFPVTDVIDLPGRSSPFPDTLPPPSVLPLPEEKLRKADTVRPGRPPPPSPAMPRPAPRPLVQRADKRLPPRKP